MPQPCAMARVPDHGPDATAGTADPFHAVRLAAHADWSADPRKCWMAVARRGAEGRWTAAVPAPVGTPSDLAALAHRLGR